MKTAVRKLHNAMQALRKANAAEKKAEATLAKDTSSEKSALANIQAQEKMVMDQFVNAQTPLDAATQVKLLGQLFALGESAATTTAKFDGATTKDKATIATDKKAIQGDRKQALKDLLPAEYEMSLKDTNRIRKELGLKEVKKPFREGFKAGGWQPGPGSLNGADTSAWESDAQFQQSIRGAKWSAIKATEGMGYTDPPFRARWDELGKRVASGQMKLRIAYHFMQPGDGVAQAKRFLGVLGINGKLKAGTRLCLDWEAQAFSDPRALRDAANYLHKVTGVWPLVYVQGSMMSTAKGIVPQAPIWEAAYGSGINRNVPFFQYSDGPGYDHDVFNGNEKALEKFAGY